MKWAEIKAKLKDIGRTSTNRRTRVVAAWLARDDEGQLFIDRPSGLSMVLRFLKQRRLDKNLWEGVLAFARAYEADAKPIFTTIKRLSKILARDLTGEDRSTLEGIRRRAITAGKEPSRVEEEAITAIEKYTAEVKFPDMNTRTWAEMMEAAALAEATVAHVPPVTDEELGLVEEPEEPLVMFEEEIPDDEEDDDPPPPPPSDGEPVEPLLDFDFGFGQ